MTSVGQRKNPESPSGIEPHTFGFCAPMLYHWATETPRWARSTTKFIWHASEDGIRRYEVRFLMGTQSFFFVPRSWQDKNVFLYFFNELRTYQFLISWAPGMELYELSHQCQYLSNWAPTPPLTYINPDLLWVHRWIRGGVLPSRLEFHTLPYCS